jgi:hypothetical protein
MAFVTAVASTNFSQPSTELVSFLRDDLALPADSIELAVRHSQQDLGPLPMVLWRYGLVTLDQLEKLYDWLESRS